MGLPIYIAYRIYEMALPSSTKAPIYPMSPLTVQDGLMSHIDLGNTPSREAYFHFSRH